MKQTVDFIKKCKTFFVSTVYQGKPATRPFGAITYHDGNVYITTGKNRNTFKHLSINPNVQLVALEQGTRNWARISGVCVEEPSLEIKRVTFGDNPILEQRYDTISDPNLALLRIDATEIEKHF